MSSCSSTTSTPDKEFTNDYYSDCPKDAVEFEVQNSYTKIGGWAFYNCVALKTIKLPKSIKRINKYAFFNCSSLQTIDLPPPLTTLDDHAFSDCSSLQEIDLPSSLTTLRDEVFAGCSSLHKINLPPSLITVGDNVFYGCSSLKEINGPPSLRDFITGGVNAVDVQISNEKNETLEGFLGEKFFSAMKTELDDIGVGEVEDLKELDTEDLNKLAAKLRKVQAKKFLRKMSEFIDRD